MHFHDHELFHSHRRRGWGIAMHVRPGGRPRSGNRPPLRTRRAVSLERGNARPGAGKPSRLDFWHAVGLLLLARILVGGFHRGGLFGGRRHWGHREDWRQYEDWWREVGHKSFAEFTAAAPPKEPGS